MTPEDLNKHAKMLDKSVVWIQKKTEKIWNRYEEIDDCHTDDCENEKGNLINEMNGHLDKLQTEEKMLDQYEEILHNKTGIK